MTDMTAPMPVSPLTTIADLAQLRTPLDEAEVGRDYAVIGCYTRDTFKSSYSALGSRSGVTTTWYIARATLIDAGDQLWARRPAAVPPSACEVCMCEETSHLINGMHLDGTPTNYAATGERIYVSFLGAPWDVIAEQVEWIRTGGDRRSTAIAKARELKLQVDPLGQAGVGNWNMSLDKVLALHNRVEAAEAEVQRLVGAAVLPLVHDQPDHRRSSSWPF